MARPRGSSAILNYQTGMPWHKIKCLPNSNPLSGWNGPSTFFLLKNSDGTNWLVGQYKHLTDFATRLRHDQQARNLLVADQVRIGLRGTDIPPANIERQNRYGKTIQCTDSGRDFAPLRLNQLALPVTDAQPQNRKTDREQNVKTFWESQTPQSHHIVEFNHLEALGVSHEKGESDMDYLQLPAVLLSAEFHQRYISAILKPTHHLGRAKLKTDISFIYSDLYRRRSELFNPVWLVSQIILKHAGITTNGNQN